MDVCLSVLEDEYRGLEICLGSKNALKLVVYT